MVIMKDKANSLLEEDTGEMRIWKGLNQEEIDQCWKNLAEKMEEGVLDKYKVEDSKRQAYRCRGSPFSTMGRRLLGENLRFVQ